MAVLCVRDLQRMLGRSRMLNILWPHLRRDPFGADQGGGFSPVRRLGDLLCPRLGSDRPRLGSDRSRCSTLHINGRRWRRARCRALKRRARGPRRRLRSRWHHRSGYRRRALRGWRPHGDGFAGDERTGGCTVRCLGIVRYLWTRRWMKVSAFEIGEFARSIFDKRPKSAPQRFLLFVQAP
jgi:hypothetical protein